jgi:arginase
LTDELRLICWPFHNGLRNVGMGSGASRLLADEPLCRAIQAEGWSLSCEQIEAVDESRGEIARVMELVRRLADRVRAAKDDGAFPLVLAGGCNSSLGTTAAITTGEVGVVWFDAHADFDDPDENTSGFFDVMGLAMLTGRGWRAQREAIPGHEPIPERNVILAGVRDLEAYQRERLETSDVTTIPGAVDPVHLEAAVGELAQRVTRVYLHFDLDTIDAGDARANEYAAAGGPTVEHAVECVRLVCNRLPLAAAALTAYDPAFDEEGRTLAAARAIGQEIAHGVRP